MLPVHCGTACTAGPALVTGTLEVEGLTEMLCALGAPPFATDVGAACIVDVAFVDGPPAAPAELVLNVPAAPAAPELELELAAIPGEPPAAPALVFGNLVWAAPPAAS